MASREKDRLSDVKTIDLIGELLRREVEFCSHPDRHADVETETTSDMRRRPCLSEN